MVRQALRPRRRNRRAPDLANHSFRVIRSSCQSQLRGRRLEYAYAILGFLPSLLWLLYFYRRDRSRPRSFRIVLRVFLYGCASTIPTFLTGQITGATILKETLFESAVASFCLIAPSEEFFKLLAVWIAVYRSPDFRESIDGVVYAATAALGFAAVENVLYLGDMGPKIIVSRALYATPAHVLFSCMWGYSLGRARFLRNGEFVTIIKGFLLAVCFHGAYNFLVAIDPKKAVISLIPLMIFMVWLASHRIREFRVSFPFDPIGDVVLICCPICGAYTPEEDIRCPRCGRLVSAQETDTPRFCGRCRAQLDPRRPACPGCGAVTSVAGTSRPFVGPFGRRFGFLRLFKKLGWND